MNNEPAFPVFPETGGGHAAAFQGMTLRDYFAAKALAIMWDAYDKGYCGMEDSDKLNIKMVSEGAYQLADAMLKAREA
jgi:hypothetical protein